jgi:VWFA-related protein
MEKLRSALPTAIAPDAPTPLWLAANEALDGFGDASDKRRVLLIFSDGKDNGPLRFRQRPISEAATIDRGHREDVMIYAIGMRSRSKQSLPPGVASAAFEATLMSDMPDPGLERVAEETGGGYTEIRTGQDLGAAFARVANELHSQYLLGYSPPKRDGKAHDITVSLPGRNLTPRARKSYVAPKE